MPVHQPLDSPSTWLSRVCPDTEMGRAVADLDWAATPLGHPDSWSIGLRVAVSTCMTSRFPMLVTWGPDLTEIYNDGYRDILGSEKHPGALGAPARLVWSEVWDEIGPLFASVMTTGEPVYVEDLELVVERNGYPEETHFLFCYSPLFDDDGSIGGVLDVVVETTDQVVDRRRLACVAELAEAMREVEDLTEACVRAATVLAGSRADVRNADIFLDIDGRLTPAASNRTGTAPRLSPFEIEKLRGAEASAREVGGGTLVLDDRIVLTIGAPGRLRGALVVEPSRTRPLDEAYLRFLRLVAGTIDGALQVSYRHATEIGEYRLISDTLQRAMLDPVDDVATVAARYVPAAGNLSVGGDWYDVIDLGPDQRALVVGDCVGHGLDAAAAMAQLRSVVRAMLLEGRDPASVLDALDLFADRIDDAKYATVVVLIIDRTTGLVTYSRAGHVPPLVIGAAGTHWLDGAGSLPLAVRTPAGHTNGTHQLRDDEVLVIYSDGLIERRGESIDVGMARLEGAVRSAASTDVQAIADHVLRDLVPDRADDDVVFIVKRLERTEGSRIGSTP